MKRIGAALQNLFFAGKAEKEQINGQKKGDTAKKKIPVLEKNNSEVAGKQLSQREITQPDVLPPAFKLQDSNKEKISSSLWSHWSGKKEQKVIECYSKLQAVNAAATLVIGKLLGNGKQLFSCQVPGVLIMIDEKVLSDFPERISSLLEKALTENQDFRQQLFSSDGLLKTPVLIAQDKDKQQVLSPDALEAVTPSVTFYPYVDTGSVSGSGMLTLYIDGQKANESRLATDLQKGLRKAMNHANDNLPDESRAIIYNYLRLDTVHDKNQE